MRDSSFQPKVTLEMATFVVLCNPTSQPMREAGFQNNSDRMKTWVQGAMECEVILDQLTVNEAATKEASLVFRYSRACWHDRY